MELKIEHLSKQFKDKTAVNDVNLTLTPGVWGLLGANGAGKTTLMRMIADIMTPTNGAVYYDGKDIRELGEVYRSKFGFLPQDFGYYRDFTVKDYLEYMAALKDMVGKGEHNEQSRKCSAGDTGHGRTPEYGLSHSFPGSTGETCDHCGIYFYSNVFFTL